MTSNWTPESLTALDLDKKPYIWLDCSSSNVSSSSDFIVSGLRDLTGNGYDMLSMQDYDQSQILIPLQIDSNKINDLKTVTFVKPLFYTSSGLTQPLKVEKFNTLSGYRAGIVLVARQGEVPGTLFGLNQKYDSNKAVTASNYPNPWRFKRTSTIDQYIANGNFATDITSDATLFKTNSTSYVSSSLCNIPVPPSNTLYMLSISNLTGSNQIFNGFGFNCETLQKDGGAGPSNLNAWTGDFGEVVFWQQSAVDDSTLQKRVEGYLAHKWGVSDFLPSSHTHKSSAPSFSTAYPAPFGNTSGSFVYPLLWLDASNPLSLQTKYVVKLTDKSSNGYNLQTRPECKRNIVWPTEGKLLNGLKTTRFTQWAGLTQPTSIENVSDLFFVGIQNAIPSNATNGWPENLLGHDNYEDFGCSLGNYNLDGWHPGTSDNSPPDLFTRLYFRAYAWSTPTEVIGATGPATITWKSSFTPGESGDSYGVRDNNLYKLYSRNNVNFTVQIFRVQKNPLTGVVSPDSEHDECISGTVNTFSRGNDFSSDQFTNYGSGSFSYNFTGLSNQTLYMMLRVADTNRRPGGTFSPAGTILITSQTPKLYVNTSFPTQTLNPTIYYQSNGALVHNNNFPPVGSPFILALKLPQTATQKITARFQGISYDSFNSNSGWTGDFAEMIVYKKKNLTENQSNLVLTYLANKWGFSLADSSPPVVLPNVKPFSDFTPLSFNPVAWYDSSDSQIAKSLQTFGTIINNNTVKCVSNGTDVSGITPLFGIPVAVVAGKMGAFSGLSGTGCCDRTINGLNTMYVDNETTLLYESSAVFGTSSNKLTNIFFVGRQGQYSGQFSQWNPILTYSANGGDNIVYKGYTFISLAIANNINQVPPVDGTSTSYWKPVVKYQTLFGNLGYNVANPSETSNSNNILLGGKVVTYFQSQISSGTTVTSVASQASNSTYALSANVFTKFTTGDSNVNSNLLKASAACYSINQLGTARYQTTSAATQFVKAENMTAETVVFPAPASTFLMSVNGIQANGTQNTPFRGFFYDNVSSKDGWEGDFGEIITFTKNLTPQEILLVEGYLATKWGLQSGLPTTHPFHYSGNPGLTPCLTGYSPLYFGAIGADINSTNDKLNLFGLGLTLQIPQNSYTSSSLLSYLNSILPNSISVSYSEDYKLLWNNTNASYCSIVASTSQGATALGIEPPPYFFSIQSSSQSIVQSPYPIIMLSYNYIVVSQNSGSFVVRMTIEYDTPISIDFPVSLASQQFPSGNYDANQFAAILQNAIQVQTGIAIQVQADYTNNRLVWSILPSFKASTWDMGAFQILSSNATTCGLLGLEVSTPLYLPYISTATNPSVGDATFGSDQGIFSVSSLNDTYTVYTQGGSNILTLTNAIYESPSSFLEEVNTELSNLLSPSSNVVVNFVYNPYEDWLYYGREPGYYAQYSYLANVEQSGTFLSLTSNGADLMGFVWYLTNGQIEFYGNYHQSANEPILTMSSIVVIPEDSYFSISGWGSEVFIHLSGSNSPIAPDSGGQCEYPKYVSFLTNAVQAAFLRRETGTTVTFVNGTSGATCISNLNAALDLIPAASNVSVSNNQGYMVWSNSGSRPIVMVPTSPQSALNLGFPDVGSIDPEILDAFTIFPNSFLAMGSFSTIPSFRKSTNAITTNPNPYIVIPSTISFTKTINSISPSSTPETLPAGIFSKTEYAANGSAFFTMESNNYLMWSNSTPTTYTQTISVAKNDPVSALVLGILINGDETQLEIGKSVTLGSSKPEVDVNDKISPNSLNDTFQIQGIGLSPHTISITFPHVVNGFNDFNTAIDAAIGESGLLIVDVTARDIDDKLTTASRFEFTNTSTNDITIVAGAEACTLLGITSPYVLTNAYAKSHFAITETLIPIIEFSGTVTVNGQLIDFGPFPTTLNPTGLANYLNGYATPVLNVTSISFFNNSGVGHITYTVPSTVGYYINSSLNCSGATDNIFNGNFYVEVITATTITVGTSLITGSHPSSTASLSYTNGYGFQDYEPNLLVTIGPGNYLIWENKGPNALTVLLNSVAGSLLGESGEIEFVIPPTSRKNFSPLEFLTTNTSTQFNLYGLGNPVPKITVVETDGFLQWTNNSAYNLTLYPNYDGETSSLLGFSLPGETESSLLVPSSSSISPYPISLTPFLSGSQTFSLYGLINNASTEITLVDGIYNALNFSAMIQKAILTALGSTIVAVTYNISQKLTFTNLISTQIAITGTLEFAKAIGLVNPSTTAAGTYVLTLLPNSSTLAPYPLSLVTLLNVCVWDGQESCPTNYTEVTSDSNELALPYAKRCAKPFSSLLPQVLTNAGLSNQSYSCPIGTELIGKNQNADPDHPVCSYVCDPPYFDSGTTCGYFPVYSPRDNKSINILKDNSSANVTEVNLANTTAGSTSSALRFMILAVIVSFLIGLAIKAFPTLTANPPTESAAGSVLESVIQSQGQGLKTIGKNADWPQNWRKGFGKR